MTNQKNLRYTKEYCWIASLYIFFFFHYNEKCMEQEKNIDKSNREMFKFKMPIETIQAIKELSMEEIAKL